MGKEQEDGENEVISSFGSFSADFVLVRCFNRRFDGQCMQYTQGSVRYISVSDEESWMQMGDNGESVDLKGVKSGRVEWGVVVE